MIIIKYTTFYSEIKFLNSILIYKIKINTSNKIKNSSEIFLKKMALLDVETPLSAEMAC